MCSSDLTPNPKPRFLHIGVSLSEPNLIMLYPGSYSTFEPHLREGFPAALRFSESSEFRILGGDHTLTHFCRLKQKYSTHQHKKGCKQAKSQQRKPEQTHNIAATHQHVCQPGCMEKKARSCCVVSLRFLRSEDGCEQAGRAIDRPSSRDGNSRGLKCTSALNLILHTRSEQMPLAYLSTFDRSISKDQALERLADGQKARDVWQAGSLCSMEWLAEYEAKAAGQLDETSHSSENSMEEGLIEASYSSDHSMIEEYLEDRTFLKQNCKNQQILSQKDEHLTGFIFWQPPTNKTMLADSSEDVCSCELSEVNRSSDLANYQDAPFWDINPSKGKIAHKKDTQKQKLLASLQGQS